MNDVKEIKHLPSSKIGKNLNVQINAITNQILKVIEIEDDQVI